MLSTRRQDVTITALLVPPLLPLLLLLQQLLLLLLQPIVQAPAEGSPTTSV